MYKYLWDMLQLFTAVLLGAPFGTQCYKSQLERTGQVDKSGSVHLEACCLFHDIDVTAMFRHTCNATFSIATY